VSVSLSSRRNLLEEGFRVFPVLNVTNPDVALAGGSIVPYRIKDHV